MSPGVTFERVYRELKRRLADGTFKPGQPIEPAAMSAELAASITPIRDALHRLVGERLVEAPNHNGFRVPRLTEAELRDLYLWNGQLLSLAIPRIRVAQDDSAVPPSANGNVASQAAVLFLRIARTAGSGEHLRAIAQLSDRLGACRNAEAQVLGQITEELETLTRLFNSGERASLIRALASYHRRRVAAVHHILAVLRD